jgi:hypothetical protein
MGIRARVAGFAAAGLLVVAPIVVAQQPAGAATNRSDKSTDFTFGDFQDLNQTCTIAVHGVRDTSTNTARGGSGMLGPGECFDISVSISLDYRDTHGRAQHVQADANDLVNISATDAVSNVKATLTVTFRDCNPGTNATCTATVVAAPK